MKKILSIIAVLLMAATTVSAQSAIELAKQKAEEEAFYKKMLNAKPTKDAKKQAKELKRDGWTVPAGEKSLEQQITESQMYASEQMLDENAYRTKRYVQQNGMSTAGSYNAGYAAARANAQNEIAAMLKTQIASAMQSKLDNAQSSGINAVSVDKFNQRSKAIVDECLTNSIPVVAMYRRLANNNFEVQVRLAFDKRELMARLKRNMQRELEQEGDELNGLVDEVIMNQL